MRIRSYVIAAGLCGLGLFAPAVARAANCTEGNPFTRLLDISGAPYKLKVVCKGEWSIIFVALPNGDEIPAQFDAFEDNTDKECHATMTSPTGGTAEFEEQQTTCKFTRDLQVKFSLKKQ
jgi:hypothetical protein